MFLYILIGGIIFFIPSWIAFTIGIVIDSDILIAFSAAYILLWVGPFTPTIPAIFAIAVALKQLIKNKNKPKE